MLSYVNKEMCDCCKLCNSMHSEQQINTKNCKKYEKSLAQWRAGGKPSTWFPPGRLVEQRSVKEDGIYRKRLEGNGAKKQRKEAADIDKSKIRHHMTN